jgi:hypothetical protein
VDGKWGTIDRKTYILVVNQWVGWLTVLDKKKLKIYLEFVYLIFYKLLLLLQRIAVSKSPSYTTIVFFCLVPSGCGSSSGSYTVGVKQMWPSTFPWQKEICWFWKDETAPQPITLFLSTSNSCNCCRMVSTFFTMSLQFSDFFYKISISRLCTIYAWVL